MILTNKSYKDYLENTTLQHFHDTELKSMLKSVNSIQELEYLGYLITYEDIKSIPKNFYYVKHFTF